VFAADGVGLVHTRLSLVDLHERSNQPFWDDTGRYALIYNGELYDYAALKSRLEGLGARFHTTSDTEVLLAALIRLGVEETLKQVEGMFAFALFDTREQVLVVARDRFGIKPLYVHESDDVFLFGSTVGSMAPWIPLRANALTVSAFVQGFNGPMSGQSFYEGVDIVPPGAVIRVKRGGAVERRQYFRLPDLVDPALADSLARMSERDVVDTVEQALLASVNSQLVADAPVGAFCSGGVDSSLLMAMAARSHGDLQVFHADVEGRLSERSAAEALARHLKLDLRTVAVRDHHFVDTIPAVVEHYEFPAFVHGNTVAVRLVSNLVRENGVKAVLTGEGSDECFLGYPWLVPNLRATISGIPGRIAGRMKRLVRSTPRASGSDRDTALARGVANGFEIALGAASYGESETGPAGAGPTTDFARGGELSYILRLLLHRNDTMGMSASIEARFPFLDSRLVRIAANLPSAYKIRFSTKMRDPEHPFYRDKWVVRQIADRYVPASLSQRKKLMFLTNAFERTRIEDVFFEGGFVQEFFALTPRRLRYLLTNASHPLRMRLLHLEAWGEQCLRDDRPSELAERLARHVKVVAP
jgi:asparagine synthase (glutamine-hydrolysing)